MQTSELECFVQLVADGVKNWLSAGKLLVRLRQRDENIYRKLINACEWLTVDVLATFERIGRLELRPEMLLLNGYVGDKLMRLGYSQQTRIIDKGRVEVVCDFKQDGTALKTTKRLSELTKADVDILVDGSKCRTLTEQEQWLRRKRGQKLSESTRELKAIALETPQKKLMFIGCYRLVWRSGVPALTKCATIPLNAQRVTLTKEMGEDVAFLELMKWSD